MIQNSSNIQNSIVADLLGVEVQSVPRQLSNIASNLTVPVEPGKVLVSAWLLFVVESGQGVESSSYLENLAHFVLKQLFGVAVVVEAELSQVVKLLLDCAVIIETVVEVVN